MPKQQIRTNKAFLQSDFEGTNNNQTEANSLVAGNHNYINFENNVVAGDRNSAAGQAMILGNNNLVGNPSRVAVIGRDNILTSVEGMIIGASNSITTPVKNFNLFGVNGLSMTQSVNDVWIFGNPQNGTYSIGTQSFTNTLTAPTQSGIYLNQPVYLGPSVNIFNNNGSTLGNQNLNQVLTVGNTTGGQDIELTSGDLVKGQLQGELDFDYGGGGKVTLSLDNTLNEAVIIDTNTVNIVGSSNATLGVGNALVSVGTTNEEDFRFNTYAFKEINIGDWDMDATGTLNVAHSLSATEYKTIRNIQVTIRDDNDTNYYDLSQDTGNAGIVNGGIAQWNATNIILVRRTGGSFDNTTFDATSYNRGWIRFQYKPD